MEKQIYPIGEQNFREIRLTNKVYVDKTQFIPKLIDNKFYFLSRPRRFGKSLFLSTLEYFFRGEKDLFKGLAVESMEWEWKEFPIIRIDLSNGSFSQKEGLEERLYEIIRVISRNYNVSVEGSSPRAKFNSLILRLKESTGMPVVVLIDEYEKPLLDSSEQTHNTDYQNQLRDFYSVLKDNGENIKMLFITGVTRFGHLNIFSGLNNLIDISLDNEFSSICGITEKELRDNFGPGIEAFASINGYTYEEVIKELKLYYDGYHFSRLLEDIYNPFSLISCLRVSDIVSRWFLSGSSSFLINKLRKAHFNIENLDGIRASESDLLGVDASMNNIVTLLYQSGYLTIKSYDIRSRSYLLGLPNREVSEALYSAIIPFYLGEKYRESRRGALDFIEMLNHGEANEAMKWLQGYFSSIPPYIKLDFESEFQQVVYAFFALTGQLANTTLEKKTSDGRIDMVYETEDYVYVFEFKRGEDPLKALKQINDKQYPLQWQADRRKVIKIGVAFSVKSRGISGFAIE